LLWVFLQWDSTGTAALSFNQLKTKCGIWETQNVGLGISPKNADPHWIPIHKSFHQIRFVEKNKSVGSNPK